MYFYEHFALTYSMAQFNLQRLEIGAEKQGIANQKKNYGNSWKIAEYDTFNIRPRLTFFTCLWTTYECKVLFIPFNVLILSQEVWP